MASILDAAKPTRAAQVRLVLPMIALAAIAVLAVGYVTYLLWPRWPASIATADPPELPIILGNVTFDVPPAAIRVPVQRRPGVQERLDLAFLWPTLEPPTQEKVTPQPVPDAEPKPIDRVFVTVAAANGTLTPIERLNTIYPRYVAQVGDPAAVGMVGFRFRDGTPYQGEDLIYDAAQPQQFFVRCTRDGPGHVPGICLAERRIRDADLTIRFPRRWLDDWRAVAGGIDRLIAKLKPH
jgi:hypothetical protein